MRRTGLTASIAVAALLPVGVAAAAMTPPVKIAPVAEQPLSAAATQAARKAAGDATPVPNRAGARASLTVTAKLELQCGLPSHPVRVTLPAAEHVPALLPAAAVKLGTKAAGRVVVHGHTVTIAPARRTGMTCGVVGILPLKIVFTAAAGLQNPHASGSYTVTVVSGASRDTATFSIRA